MTIKFTSIDTVILQTINSGQGLFNKGVTLEKIVGQGDAINRTIFQYDELFYGLQKLLTIDFIKIENDKVYTTKFFRQQKRKHCKRTWTVPAQYDELNKLLLLNSDKEFKSLEDLPKDFLTETTLKSAITLYALEMKDIISRM